MAHVVLFHSVLGLRPVEHRFAARLREAGHHVDIPGLFGGRTASTLEAGFAIKDDIGWATLERRAAEALDGLPADTVLVGLSMGAALAQNLLPHRPAARALLLHALAAHPAPAPGVDVQVHVADPDPFAPPAALDAWRAAGAPVFTYPGAGHFYTDEDLPDHDERAAALTHERVLDFLRRSEPGSA